MGEGDARNFCWTGEVTNVVREDPARSLREEGEAGRVSARRGERGPSGLRVLLGDGVDEEASVESFGTTELVEPSVELRLGWADPEVDAS